MPLEQSRLGLKYLVRFQSKIACKGETDCWDWTGSMRSNGYGDYWDGTRNCMTHRLAYELAHPEVRLTEQEVIRHSCDNRRCVNPAHLFKGTQDDNMKDMVEKGRSCRGEAVRTAKLTEQDVRDIAAWYATGTVSVREIAAKYGLEKTPIQRIITGEGWRHVERQDTSLALKSRDQRGGQRRRGENGPTSKLTEADVRQIVRFFDAGKHSQQQLAEMFSVNRCTIGDILCGRTWKHITQAMDDEEQQ